MTSFLFKDVLLIWRDKKELALLLLMPFVLTVILGFALSGWIESEHAGLQMTVLVVNEDDEEAGRDRIVSELQSMPEAARLGYMEALEKLNPHTWIGHLSASPDLASWIDWEEADRDSALNALEQEQVDAVLIIPAGFTYDTLNRILLSKGDGGRMLVETSGASALKSGVFAEIIDGFVQTINFHTALGQTLAMGEPVTNAESDRLANLGGFETVPGHEPLTSMQFFTVGMTVMFVLFVVSSISVSALHEQQNHAYDRIILSGKHPIHYLIGKAISASVIVLLQIVILFVLSTVMFRTFAGQPGSFWWSALAVSAVLAICVGSLTVLLTSICYSTRSTSASDLFASVFVAMLALVGGNIFPASGLPEWVSVLGGWTPNGAAMSAYLLIMQGAPAEDGLVYVGRMLLLSVLLLAVGIMLFPRHRNTN